MEMFLAPIWCIVTGHHLDNKQLLMTEILSIGQATVVGFGSFWPWVVSVMSRIGRGSFRLGHFGLGRFGLILGWAVSAYFGGSFRPDIPRPPPPPICYNINEFSFLISYTIACVALQSQKYPTQLRKDGDTYPNPYR